MLKVNELLDRTSKTIGSVAGISLSLAVIAIAAAVIKDNVNSLFPKRKLRIHAVCIKKSEPKVQEVVPEKKPASKKNTKVSEPKVPEVTPEKLPEGMPGDEVKESSK